MRPRRSNRSNQALTLVDVLVVVATLSLLTAVALAKMAEAQGDSLRKKCVNNLKQIADACKNWAGDNSDRFPAQVPDEKGGAMEEATRGNVAPIFQVMSNELSTPRILVCPADTGRFTADNFVTDFNNSHISYFIAVDTSDDRYPERLFSGDCNPAIDGVSVKSGLVELTTNNLVTWTSRRHFNQGNISFADGSVLRADDKLLVQKLQQTGLATNRLAIP